MAQPTLVRLSRRATVWNSKKVVAFVRVHIHLLRVQRACSAGMTGLVRPFTSGMKKLMLSLLLTIALVGASCRESDMMTTGAPCGPTEDMAGEAIVDAFLVAVPADWEVDRISDDFVGVTLPGGLLFADLSALPTMHESWEEVIGDYWSTGSTGTIDEVEFDTDEILTTRGPLTVAIAEYTNLVIIPRGAVYEQTIVVEILGSARDRVLEILRDSVEALVSCPSI